MYRFLVAVFSATALSLGVFGGAASASNPLQGADIYGVGGGKANFGLYSFSFSAHSGPNGDFGQVHFEQVEPYPFPVDVVADVDCVNVFGLPGAGNAWIGSVITKISPVPNTLGLDEGDRLLWLAVDGGEPSAAVPVDYFDGFITNLSCKLFGPSGAPPNVDHGNVVIKAG
jgi:hypothetical protein